MAVKNIFAVSRLKKLKRLQILFVL